jgi:Phosphatidylinositol 3- and 4-kinase
MSMAGYILGLGDRHPSNLMLERVSGRVVHIDFGDCFEITKQRSKYPEIIPFRLTRMMTAAMGYTGIAGTYRVTCEKVHIHSSVTVSNLLTNFHIFFILGTLCNFVYTTHKCAFFTTHSFTRIPPHHTKAAYPYTLFHMLSLCIPHSLPHSFIHSLIHSLTHSLTHSLSHLLTHSLPSFI